MQGFNMGRYYPPDMDPTKTSFNRIAHRRSPRSSNSESTITVRFAMPFPVTCTGCEQTIGQGSRFNAQKVRAGDYLSTIPIWNFSAKCYLCQHPFVIQTDPKYKRYVALRGVRTRTMEWDDEQAGTWSHDCTFLYNVFYFVSSPSLSLRLSLSPTAPN